MNRALRTVFGGVAWLLALSLLLLDNATDVFVRLGCRAADPGCRTAEATSSWHGTRHLVCFGIALLATVVAPFALGRRMRRTPGWEDFAGVTRRFGYAAIIVCGLAVFARRFVQLESRPLRATTLMAGR